MEVWQLTVLGSPAGGTFEMGGIRFNHDDTSEQVAEKIAAKIGSPVIATGGPFPHSSINVEVPAGLPMPYVNWQGLVGDGVAVIVSRIQPVRVA